MSAWLHEEIAIVATVDPVDANNTDTSSDVVDMSKFHEVMVIIQLGVIAASTSSTVTVKESSNSDGSSPTTITGKTVTYDNDDDGFQYIISVKAEEMTKRYLIVTQDNSAHSQLAAILVLGRPRYLPATDEDLSSVQTVVT